MSIDRIFGTTRGPRARARHSTGAQDIAPTRRPPRVAPFRMRFDWAWIRARVAAHGIPPGDIDDVAQEVVISMSEAEPRLVIPPGRRPAEVRRAVLRTIVRRRVANYWQARAGRPTELHADDELAFGTFPSAEEEAVALGRLLELEDALAELEHTRPDAHAVLVAYELDGEAMGRLAGRLGIPENTAWTRLREGRLRLQEIVTRQRAAEQFKRTAIGCGACASTRRTA